MIKINLVHLFIYFFYLKDNEIILMLLKKKT
jgi:hypothetical protein